MPLSPPWFIDRLSPYELHRHRVKKVLVQTKTKFQQVILADLEAYGRCLILDDEIQSAQKDEFIYHEALVHPAMALHPQPRDILILGGGEGATAREILRHPAVRRVTMVDIDGETVAFCRTYLRPWHQGSFDHAKTRLLIEDAYKYILETREQFDIIISDLPTPQGPGPVARLYSNDFYQRLKRRLNPGGLLVVQAGSGQLFQDAFHRKILKRLDPLWKTVRSYYAFVPSFAVPWSFVIAADELDPRTLSATRVDRRLGTLARELRFYDGETHEGLFRVPKYFRAGVK